MVSERRQISGEISAMEQERAGLHTSLNEQRPGRPDDARRSLSSAPTRIKCPSSQPPARPSTGLDSYLPVQGYSLDPRGKPSPSPRRLDVETASYGALVLAPKSPISPILII